MPVNYLMNFNPIIVLFLTRMYKLYAPRSMNFNPIIVLFLTSVDELTSLVNNFNPIIVLFLTCRMTDTSKHLEKFQSYYSLISNYNNYRVKLKLLLYFNPIIVLFLTPKEVKKIICPY